MVAVASARFVSSRPETGGRGDWIAKIMGAFALVLGRRQMEVPRHVTLRVEDDRLWVFGRGRRELASWDRRHVQLSAERRGGKWWLWVQPPGGRAGFELRARCGAAADSVVAALSQP